MKTTVYFSKWILLPDGNFLKNGAIAVSGDTITGIGARSSIKRTSKDRIVNLRKRILLPGLINMHTHLEETVVRGAVIYDNQSFTSWKLKKDAILNKTSEKSVSTAIRLGIREFLANGTTSIVDTSRTDLSSTVLREEPVRSWVIHEITHKDEYTEDNFIDTINMRISKNRTGIKTGISPHALFSIGPKFHKKLINFCRRNNYLWACHTAESVDELSAFSEHAGDLYFLLTQKKKWEYGKKGRGSMYYAVTNNLIPNRGILYHCNYVSGEELSLLAVKNVSIVLCSRYNSILRHKSFPMEAALNRKINLCIGTEGPVDCNSMNLFDELYHLKEKYPYLPEKEIFEWATKNPARALRCGNTLGTLEPGKKADIIGIKVSSHPGENLFDEIFLEEPEIDFVMVNGEEIIVGK